MISIVTSVNKLDPALGSAAPGHVDAVGSVNTIKLKHYRWNTSKEGR